MEKFKLELGINDLNYVIAVLGKQSYEQVAGLLIEIQNQLKLQTEKPKEEKVK